MLHHGLNTYIALGLDKWQVKNIIIIIIIRA
jgi:hypothetical protein